MLKGWAAAVLASLGIGLLGGQARAECHADKIAELPVTMSGSQPLVHAKVNGSDEVFVADSGAFFSIISPAAASRLKLNLDSGWSDLGLGGVAGGAKAYFTKVEVFVLADHTVRNVPFIVASGAGGDAAGLLGQNLWHIGDVEYDLGHGFIRLWKPVDCHRQSMAYWAADQAVSEMDLPGTDEDNRKTLGDAYVNGVKIRVAFDSGASTSIMTTDAAARAGVKRTSPGVVPAGVSFGIGRGSVETWIAPVASFKVGDEEIRDTRLRIGDIQLGEHNGSRQDVDMLLGADFFLSHRIYVANQQHKIYFTYNGGPVFDLRRSSGAQIASDAPSTNGDVKPEEGAPTDADGFARRGAARMARHDLQPAMADFSRAITLAPGDPQYYLLRAAALRQSQQLKPAEADLDQALTLSPGDLKALTARAELRIATGNPAGAGSDLDTASRLAPKPSDLRLDLANLYSEIDRRDAAIGEYDLWLSFHPDDAHMATALNGRCWARALNGRDLDKALADCNRAVRMATKSASLLDSRGLVYLRLGQYDRAIADYDAALALQPQLAWSLYGRGLAKQRLGKRAEGEADVAKAVGLRPALPDEAKRYGIVPAAEALTAAR